MTSLYKHISNNLDALFLLDMPLERDRVLCSGPKELNKGGG